MIAKYKIKKGDDVIVIAGKDKGKKGVVLKVLREDAKVLVSGINMLTKHQKPSMGNVGGIIKIEAPLAISNVACLDPKSNKATKIGYKEVDGKKVRFAKESGETLVDKAFKNKS